MAEDAVTLDRDITADDLVDTKIVQVADTTLAKPTGTTTLVTDAKVDDVVVKTTKEIEATWPSDWREKAAGGDAKKLARLTRYASPQALADAFIAAQNRINSGDLKAGHPGENAKPEDLAAWREANGIPVTPDKYDLGREIPETSKAAIDKVLAAAHASNQSGAQIKATLDAYFESVEVARTERTQNDAKAMESAQDSLAADWGQDYRRNIALVRGFLDSAPPEVKDRLVAGRLADGTPIGSDPHVLNWLLGMALERNPTGTIVPGAGANMAQTVEDETAKIEKFMREHRTEYTRDEKMQARYRQLLEYRIQQQEKAA